MEIDTLKKIFQENPSSKKSITRAVEPFIKNQYPYGSEISNFQLIGYILDDLQDTFAQAIIKEIFNPENIEMVIKNLEHYAKKRNDFTESVFDKEFHTYCKPIYKGRPPSYGTAVGTILPGYNTALGNPTTSPTYRKNLPIGHHHPIAPNGGFFSSGTEDPNPQRIPNPLDANIRQLNEYVRNDNFIRSIPGDMIEQIRILVRQLEAAANPSDREDIMNSPATLALMADLATLLEQNRDAINPDVRGNRI